tara:strand:- start:15517 stop:16509 length:993 start_codon:yes stop_codon:yes gene_type:complete
MILKLFISTAFFCVLLAQLNANSTVKESDFIPQLGNGIAAIVEGEIITFEDLRTSIDPLVSKLRLQAKNESDFKKLIDQVSKDILQNKIDRIIIVKSAEKEGLQIPSSYINQEYESVIEQQFEGNRSQFLAYLKLIGKTQEDFRNDLRMDIIVRYMRGQNQKNQAEISPEKIERFYIENKLQFYQSDAIHLKQIILTAEGETSIDDIKQIAGKIVNELEKGVPFQALAKTYGKGTYNKPNGDWGWVKRDDLRSEISNVAFALTEKTHSQPVLLGNSIFILYAEAIEREGIQPISKVRDVIENRLRQEITRESIENWLIELRKEAYVRYFM